MGLCESEVDSASDYDVNLKQKVETVSQDKIVFGQPWGEDRCRQLKPKLR